MILSIYILKRWFHFIPLHALCSFLSEQGFWFFGQEHLRKARDLQGRQLSSNSVKSPRLLNLIVRIFDIINKDETKKLVNL